MLNGIGGNTIAEAKATLSYAEVLAWVAYRDKHGSLNFAARQELSAAIVARQVNRIGGGTAELQDFMPHHVRPGTDLERAMAEWH
ncbi:phage tail assembly protein T [Pseudomonas sp. p1(2021b)]|uniref:phage tail assembly protein T n=1 Tax=Pseudomonas sp. p1(2021b) TaxID=2874628 RepID=UPI003D2AF888